MHDALVAAGHRVDTQIGCSGYRIDLAVLHPDPPGEHLLGVECDGAPYHSAATARDRDRLREQVLRGLGWRTLVATGEARPPAAALAHRAATDRPSPRTSPTIAADHAPTATHATPCASAARAGHPAASDSRCEATLYMPRGKTRLQYIGW